MAELEIGVLRGQCLNRRIGERNKLVSEIAAWQTAQQCQRTHQVDVHHSQGPRQARPRLS
jgi:hypothetical protein